MTTRNLTNTIVAGVCLVLSMGVSAQMHVDASGQVGVGTASPSKALHVKTTDAQIVVETDNVSAGPRTLFLLQNSGNTKFGVSNTQAGVEWAFANPGSGFRLSRQGSGFIEMEIFNNGNMRIEGNLTQNSDVNAKTAITEVDVNKILELVASLPLSKWEYKDALGEPHIGPMAQDFYAAFGLGATETGISTIDTAGVALAAIKALAAKNALLEVKNRDMENSINQLQEANNELAIHQQQQFQQLKEMVVDLQMNAHSKGLLTDIN